MKFITLTLLLTIIFLSSLPKTAYSQQRYQYSNLWTDTNTGANPVWREYKNSVETSVPEIGINGGLKLNAYLNVTSDKYEFIIEGKAFLENFGIRKPSWTSYYFNFPGKDVNSNNQSDISPTTFIVNELQVEITNEFVPEFYLLLPITMSGKWTYSGDNKDVQLYDKLLGYKTDLGVKIKENSGKNDAAISGLKHGFKIKLVKKGRLIDDLLISDLRNFVNTKERNQTSTTQTKPEAGNLSSTQTSNNIETGNRTNSTSNNRSSYTSTRQETPSNKEIVDRQNDLILNQGNQIYQQSQAIENTIYEGAENLKSVFDQNIERQNREAAINDAIAEREWEERERQKELDRLEEERLDREYREKKAAQEKAFEEKLDQKYEAKGGYTNYQAKEKELVISFNKDMNAINNTLQSYKLPPYTLNYRDNCSYVEIMDGISMSKLPFKIKSNLIYTLINMRYRFKKFHLANSRYSGNIEGHNRGCGNYLDIVSQGYKKYYNINEYQLRYTFGSANSYKNGYARDVMGVINTPDGTFREAFKEAGIAFSLEHKLLEADKFDGVYNEFHTKPTGWSTGSRSKLLGSTEIEKEAQRYLKFYELRKKYGLQTKDDDRRLAIFHYHRGDYQNAMLHYKMLIFNVFGTFDNMVAEFANYESEHKGAFNDKNYTGKPDIDEFNKFIVWLGAILYTENEEYNKALNLLRAYEKAYPKFMKMDNPGKYTLQIVEQTDLLKEDIYIKMKEWDKIYVPSEINNFYKDGTYAAYALIQKGDLKTAKKVFNRTYKQAKKYRRYKGTRTKIEVFKSVEKALYPKSKGDIEMITMTGYSFPPTNSLNNNLTLNDKNHANYLNTNYLDLPDKSKWYLDITLSTQKQDLEANFERCKVLYNSGKIKDNAVSKEFLEHYITQGIALLHLYDVIPAMLDLREMSSESDILFNELLINYLIVNYNDGSLSYKNDGASLSKLEEHISKNIESSTLLMKYLIAWEHFKVTSPKIPYLYVLADSNLRNRSDKKSGSESNGYIRTNSGLQYKIIKKLNSGHSLKDGSTYTVHYICKLSDGKIIDNTYKYSTPPKFNIEKQQLLPGFYEALKLLKPGEKGSFILPPNLAYGIEGKGSIPQNATLFFEIEVLQ